MHRYIARSWLLVSFVALSAAVPLACGSDPGKKAAYGGGGEGGAAGESSVSAGGLLAQAGQTERGGAPAAGESGEPGGRGDTPPSDGGNGVGGAATEPQAGSGNEPTAGAPNVPVLPQCDGVLSFADPYVEDQIIQQLDGPTGDLTADDVAGMTSLTIPFNDDDIDITGLECLQDLTQIYFEGGADPRPLSVLLLLPHLESLDYHQGYVADLTPYSVLTNVKSLDFSENFLTDVSPLAGLTQLQTLRLASIAYLSSEPVDVSPLAGLTNLTYLDLSQDKIADGAPLKALKKLQSLQLLNSQLPSLAFVKDLTALQNLNIANTGITVLPDLSALTQLTVLDVSDNEGLTTLQPLVDSASFGAGDSLLAYFATCTPHTANLQALATKGVAVTSNCL